MKAAASAFASGFVFALGLTIGGMTVPSNVIGFLDLTGVWKPALMLVMAGAILVYFVSYRLIMRRKRPVLESEFHIPQSGPVSARLLTGSALFGVGWGLSGFCPGPALTALGAGSYQALVFVFFMMLGMWAQRAKFPMPGGGALGKKLL